MNGGFILPLVACLAFMIAIGVILDATNTWWAERILHWPFRDMPATNGAIFLCLLVLAIAVVAGTLFNFSVVQGLISLAVCAVVVFVLALWPWPRRRD